MYRPLIDKKDTTTAKDGAQAKQKKSPSLGQFFYDRLNGKKSVMPVVEEKTDWEQPLLGPKKS